MYLGIFGIFIIVARKLIFSIDEYYHLYGRGVDKRIVFVDDYDKNRFIKLLFVSNSTKSFVYRDIQDKKLSEIEIDTKLVVIGAYCLMPNHFHILVKEISEKGISKFMGKLLTAYSSYFNKRHGRRGHLFEENFKAEHAGEDEYLKYLFSYIHLNPIKFIQKDWKENGIRDLKQAKKYLDNYRYSSYQDYVGVDREEKLILTKDVFPDYFKSIIEMQKEIEGWLNFNNK